MPMSMVQRVVSVGFVTAASIGLAACNQSVNASAPEVARVVSVDPISEVTTTPRQVCHDVTVKHREEPVDNHEIAGVAIGTVVGGLAGHQIGDGDGQTIATVAGAVAGGYAGKQIQEKIQEPNITTRTEQRCKTVTDKNSTVVAYDVAYQYDGSVHHTRMSERPGDTVQVKQGVVIVGANDNG